MLTGALSDSAISWAFSLMLALLALIVMIASLRLFCRPCRPPPTAEPLAQLVQLPRIEFLAGHRSLECSPAGSPFGSGRGLGPREISSNSFSSNGVCICSCVTSGNLKELGRGWVDDEPRRSMPAVACGTIVLAETPAIVAVSGYRSIMEIRDERACGGAYVTRSRHAWSRRHVSTMRS